MKPLPIIGPIGSFMIIGIASQQSGVTISTELLISILVNVAIIALAFGRTQNKIENLSEAVGELKKTAEKKVADTDLSHLEEVIDIRLLSVSEEIKRMNSRVEAVASRYHKLANDLIGYKLVQNNLEDENG